MSTNYTNAEGIESADFEPTVNTYSGMIGKVAKTILENGGITSKFSSLEKEPIDTGESLELVLFKEATGADYVEPTAGSSTVTVNAKPSDCVRYYHNWTRRRYDTRISRNDVRKVALNPAKVDEYADHVIQALYDGDRKYHNAAVEGLIDYVLTEDLILKDETIANTTDLLKAIKIAIDEFMYPTESNKTLINAANLVVESKPTDIVVLIPASLATDIDVDVQAGAYNLDKVKINAEIIKVADLDHVIVADKRCFQIYTRLYEYAEDSMGAYLSVNAYLHTERMYAWAQCFNAVALKIAEPTPPTEGNT